MTEAASTVAVLTTAIPERTGTLLPRCMASVAAQTHRPVAHAIVVDYERNGCAATLNAAWQAADKIGPRWVALIADDDELDPDHLATLVAAGEATGAHVVYSWGRVIGRPDLERHTHRPFNADDLKHGNYICATSLIRSSLVWALGGWTVGPAFEDWDFWLRALNHGARFHCVERTTWTYHFHGGNLSTTGVAA